MIQLRTQTPDYWGPEFALIDSDIEQISTHLLEVERPLTAKQLAHFVIKKRITHEKQEVERLLAGRSIYQPQNTYQIGDELVFPLLQFSYGKVTNTREGYNPEKGTFTVISVDIDGNIRDFAANLQAPHTLNFENGETIADLINVDLESLYAQHHSHVATVITEALKNKHDFVQLSGQWFLAALMAEVNIGHLHLTEALLEMSNGGPLSPEEILPHLEMDPSISTEIQRFSLNYKLLEDKRFDEVAPENEIAWFLHRMEPEGVKKSPERLQYRPISYDKALLSPQLLLLEQELDDEWSALEPATNSETVVFTLTYPHRMSGTIPLSSRIAPLFPPSNTPRQRIIFINEFTNEEIVGWVVREQRYVYGLGQWYQENNIPIGGFIHLKLGPKPGVLILGFDRRRAQREWMRLASVSDNRIKFELSRRSISCGYDDLLIVGTDVTAAIDALWRRIETNQRSIASILAEIFPELAGLTPQSTVHAKTLYSAVNMLRRVPPSPLFAELVRHPAFQPVGDHYWRFDPSRWQ